MDRLLLAVLFALFDFWALFVTASVLLREGRAWWPAAPYRADVALVFCAAVASATVVLVFRRCGYEMPGLTDAGATAMRRRIWLGVMMVAAVVAFPTGLGDGLSPAAVCTVGLVGLGVVSLTGRLFLAAARFALLSGYLGPSRILFVGDRACMTSATKALDTDALGLEVVGHVDAALFDAGPACRASVLDFARQQGVEEVFIALPWSDDARIVRILRDLAELPVAVHLCPDRIGGRFPPSRLRLLGGRAFMQLAHAPLDGIRAALKRCFDVAVAATALVVLAPLLVVIAMAVRLDTPGPALSRQRCYGFNGASFVVYRFRTTRAEGRHPHARRRAPRTTRIGRWLLRTKLDRVPQLYNVLRGDMSLVGPRPLALVRGDRRVVSIRSYPLRHIFRPGITGWAQVNGCRDEAYTPEAMWRRVHLDLAYAGNWSFGLDLTILRMAFTQAWFRDAF